MSPQDNFNDIMEAARQMQKSMEIAQKQLESREETGEAGGGAVKIVTNGHHIPLRVHLDASLQGKDMPTLEQLVLAALKDVVQKVSKTSQDTLIGATQDISLPDDMSALKETERQT